MTPDPNLAMLERIAEALGVPRQLDFPGVLPRKPMLPLILA